jgi:hypothetical protein
MNMRQNDSSQAEGSMHSLDLEMEKYRLDRLHELELNKFAHTLEVERLKTLTYLNGGAIAVFVALLGSIFGDISDWAKVVALISVGLWIFGLYFAASAVQLNLETQVEFNRAYHRRRRAIEWRLLKKKYNTDELKRMIGYIGPQQGSLEGKEADAQEESQEKRYDDAARNAVEEGIAKARRVSSRAKLSVLLFMVAAAFASVAIVAL